PSAGRSSGAAPLKLSEIALRSARSPSTRVFSPRTSLSSASKASRSSATFFCWIAVRTASGLSRMKARLSMTRPCQVRVETQGVEFSLASDLVAITPDVMRAIKLDRKRAQPECADSGGNQAPGRKGDFSEHRHRSFLAFPKGQNPLANQV